MRRLASLAAAAPLAAALAAPAAAATHDIVLPAGRACAGFDLGVDIGAPRGGTVDHKWYDANGNVVKTLQAGTGYQLTFFNDAAGKSIAFRSNGAALHTTYRADGSQVVSATGHTMLIMYPTDYPAGPSTTVYTGGHLVYTVDKDFNYTLLSASGNKVDVCAALR